jgi:hypothetical protein
LQALSACFTSAEAELRLFPYSVVRLFFAAPDSQSWQIVWAVVQAKKTLPKKRFNSVFFKLPDVFS